MSKSDLYWRPTKPHVGVHQSKIGGWEVTVWDADDKLIYCEYWDKRPTYQDKQYLIKKFSKETT